MRMCDGLVHGFRVDRKTSLLVESRQRDLKVFAYTHKIKRDGCMNTESVAVSVRAIFLGELVSKIYTPI